MPRHAELTPEVQKQIVVALLHGNYRKIAAEAGGIDYSTFSRWMARGKKRGKSHEPYRTFRKAVLEAEKRSETDAVARVYRQPDPRVLLDMMGRRWPERWGKDTMLIKTLMRKIDELAKRVESRQP
jgi:hypothetical protein